MTWTSFSRSWPRASTISPKDSPSPTIRPDFVTTSSPPISLAVCRTRSERSHVEPRRAIGYRRGATSTLWLKTSGRSAMTLASGMSRPWKSGVRTSTLHLGAWRRIWRMTPTNACAPLSGMSSRSTDVMTAWRRPMRATWRATRAGSSGSFQVGLPVLTWQKPQRRVHVSPRIMKVAVPRSQHSPMFGQAASWHTVCRLSSAILALSSRYIGPPGMGTLNHFGLRSRMSSTSGPRTFRTSIPPGLARERVLCSRWGLVGVVGSAAIADRRLSGENGARPGPVAVGADEGGARPHEGHEREHEERALQRGVLGRAAAPGQRHRAGGQEREVAGQRAGQQDGGRAAPRGRRRVQALATPQPAGRRRDEQAAEAHAEQRAARAEQHADAAPGQQQRRGGAAELVEEGRRDARSDDDEEDAERAVHGPPDVGGRAALLDRVARRISRPSRAPRPARAPGAPA